MFRAHVEQAIISAIKIHLLHLVGILFPHNIDDARSKPHQIVYMSSKYNRNGKKGSALKAFPIKSRLQGPKCK
jgi:hypothetical protein